MSLPPRQCEFTLTVDLFAQQYKGLEFLVPLVKDMIQADPAKRPTAQEVTRRFDELLKPLSQWRLRSRIVPAKEHPLDKLFRNIDYWLRTLRYVVARKPAIPPTPPPSP